MINDQAELAELIEPYLFTDEIVARYPTPHLGRLKTLEPLGLELRGVLKVGEPGDQIAPTRHAVVDRFEELLTALHVGRWVLTEVPDLDLRANIAPAIWTLDGKVARDERILCHMGEVRLSVTRCKERITGN
ncbi:MAG: hypothetical protein ACRD6W_11960 [Nitrososphaerales archaeon]